MVETTNQLHIERTPKKTNIHLPMFEKQQRTAAMSLKFAKTVGQPAWDAKQHQRRHWDGST